MGRILQSLLRHPILSIALTLYIGVGVFQAFLPAVFAWDAVLIQGGFFAKSFLRHGYLQLGLFPLDITLPNLADNPQWSAYIYI